jgi:hypothetical protein
MKIACCLTCTLSEAMRDCKACPFRAGLLVKAFEGIKRTESVTMPESIRVQFVESLTTIQVN